MNGLCLPNLLILLHLLDAITARPDLAVTRPAQRQEIIVCQPLAAVPDCNDMMHHVSLPDNAACLTPAAQRKLCYICGPDHLPPSIISTGSSWPTSLIVLTLRLMICTPAAICHDNATTRLLTVSLTSLVRIAIPCSHKHTAAGERAKSFRRCRHNDTNCFFDIEKTPQSKYALRGYYSLHKKSGKRKKKNRQKNPRISPGGLRYLTGLFVNFSMWFR